MSAATQLAELLELERDPVAVAFLDTPPEGLPRTEQMAAAGCGYWRRAADGEAFYTEATDHYGCPIGAHTHGIDLPEEQGAELEDVIGTMVELEYLKMQEVAEIPRRGLDPALADWLEGGALGDCPADASFWDGWPDDSGHYVYFARLYEGD